MEDSPSMRDSGIRKIVQQLEVVGIWKIVQQLEVKWQMEDSPTIRGRGRQRNGIDKVVNPTVSDK